MGFWEKYQNFRLGPCTVGAPWQKRVRKINFFKNFFDFYNKPTSDNTHAKFRQNRTIFVFWCAQWSTVVQKVSKNKNCLIVTKFGVCIVWSGLVMKMKKKFEKKNHFLDRFLVMERPLCVVPIWNFDIFFKVPKYLHVRNLKKIGSCAGYVYFTLEPENEGYSYTHVHCAQTKNILANEPSP